MQGLTTCGSKQGQIANSHENGHELSSSVTDSIAADMSVSKGGIRSVSEVSQIITNFSLTVI
jgi:hypothetical protein